MPAPGQLSAPFAHREFNGETLLEELASLRDGQVRQRQLEDCAKALRGISAMRPGEAANRVRQVAGGRFAAQPALASVMVRWAAKVRTEADAAAVERHFRQLALVGAAIGVLRRGGDGLAGGAL